MIITIPIFVVLLFIDSPIVYLIGIGFLVLYKPMMEGLFGATIGKMLLGLLVVSKQWTKIGLVTAVIRASLFIVASIPSYMTYYKMKQEEISITDMAAMAAFQEANKSLQYLGNALSIITLIACVVVAFNVRKRGLHDMLADTFVVYKETLPRA